MNYLIREIEEKDLDQLLILCSKHAEYEKAPYRSAGKKEKLHSAIFSDPKQFYGLVVEVSEEIVGYATYTFDFSTWDAQKFIYLDCLYLEDYCRSYGIGQVLIEKVKETGQLNGCINMQWQTPEFNERAIQFYNRIGAIGKGKVRFCLPL